MDLTPIHYFFDCCLGRWSIERTYHYLRQQLVERSHTDFYVEAITPELRRQVLADNHYPAPEGQDLDQLPGFQLRFHTVSETGEQVSQELRALFVPRQQQGEVLTGDYLRSRLRGSPTNYFWLQLQRQPSGTADDHTLHPGGFC